jgi:hypothetical protein
MKIVFVHLGPAEADHLRLNIRRLQREFTNLEIVLIYDSESFIKKIDFSGIQIFKYERNPKLDSIFDDSEHNIQFRQGFWRYSVERLIAISEYHNLFPEEMLLHIESDILLLPDFPMKMIEQLSVIAWCKFNETHDVASIIVFPDYQASAWLASELITYLNSDRKLTDMTALRQIAKNNSNKVFYLNGPKSIDIFKGEFDAAPFGMWLNGRDPRNHFGFVRRFLPLPESGIYLESVQFKFENGHLSYSNKELNYRPLYNLHIHSKRKLLFGKLWKLFLHLDVLTSRTRFPSNWFSISAFVAIMKDYYRRNQPITINKIVKRLFFRDTYENSRN